MTKAQSPSRTAEIDAPLRLSLSGVAELAKVRRPVASMWRTRFMSGDDAFPSPVALSAGSPLFEASEVAYWLTRTGHGNNPDAVLDAAASAAPTDLDWANVSHVAELDALIALSASLGGLAEMTSADLRRAAEEADPTDALLRSEVGTHVDRGANWARFADALIDAAYAPAGALELSHARHSALSAADGSAGALADPVIELVAAVAAALAEHGHAARATLGRGIDGEVALRIVRGLGGETTPVVDAAGRVREIRRRFAVAGEWLEESEDDSPVVRTARVPATADDDVEAMLADIDDVALSLGPDDTAVLVGPARALIDPLPARERPLRDAVLRSGRLRAAIRLPKGLVKTASREILALWVLGPPTGDVALDERFTAVADLIDRELSVATRADLVSDVLAGMGSAADVRARTFRFARLVRTASLLARSNALLPPQAPRPPAAKRGATLAARLDAAAQAAAGDIPERIVASPASAASDAETTLADLISDGHARIIAGTRLALEVAAESATGLVIVSTDELDNPAQIGRRRIDGLAFAQRHPSAQLTRPGDVVFRAGPTVAAWVDHEGSKVVRYPARVLRITATDPGGLVPELVAADIAAQAAGPGAWRRWVLRRVAPAAIAPLRAALHELADARSELERRISNLDHYADTLTAAVAAGAVTLSDPTADAASDPQ